LFAVLALVFVLAVSSFSPVFAAGFIHVDKVTTNGDTETIFLFDASNPLGGFQLVGGESTADFPPQPGGQFPGPFFTSDFPITITEEVPHAWVLTDVTCVDEVTPSVADFEYIPGGVIITIPNPELCDTNPGGDRICFVLITCTFTNSPQPVGGVVIPADKLAIVAPWLAVIGLVGCIGVVGVVLKKHR
jgi:hypothetical protein